MTPREQEKEGLETYAKGIIFKLSGSTRDYYCWNWPLKEGFSNVMINLTIGCDMDERY